MLSFFCKMQRPPSSTLFPYTTLFRSIRPGRRGERVAGAADRGHGDRVAWTATATGSVGDLDDAVGSAFGVDHRVVDEGVVTRLGEFEFDEPALGGREIQGLARPLLRIAAFEPVGAFLEHGVELSPDDVEGARPIRSGVDDPDAHALTVLLPDMVVGVFIGVSVVVHGT